jgi:hypothetical protein
MGDLVILNNNNFENSFVEKLFLPFTVLEFILTGNKTSSNNKFNSSRILIVIVEND